MRLPASGGTVAVQPQRDEVLAPVPGPTPIIDRSGRVDPTRERVRSARASEVQGHDLDLKG